MSRWAYVDRTFVPIGAQAIRVEDRGFQFADGIYEVWSLWNGWLLDADLHLARLRRSAAAIRIPFEACDRALLAILRETVSRNRLKNGLVYLQLTRGAAVRDHAFPTAANPTLVVTARPISREALRKRAEVGVAVRTMPDERWARCDIKSVSLLPNVLAKQVAREEGAYEAWLTDPDGFVTEGASSTAWIVDGEGVLRTRPLSPRILPSITREVLLGLARDRQMRVSETPFTPHEAKSAQEAFMSAASGALTPIVRIDDAIVGDGRPGPVSRMLRDAYFATVPDRSRSAMLQRTPRVR